MAKFKATEKCFVNGKIVDKGDIIIADIKDIPKHLVEIKEEAKAKAKTSK